MKLIKMVKKERDDNAKREQSNQNTYVWQPKWRN